MGLFFKKTKNYYVFDYKPIYYDQKKDDREKRFKEIRKDLGIIDENDTNIEGNYKANISFRNRIGRSRKDNSSTVRLLIILTLLVVCAYLFLYTDVFNMIARLLDKF